MKTTKRKQIKYINQRHHTKPYKLLWIVYSLRSNTTQHKKKSVRNRTFHFVIIHSVWWAKLLFQLIYYRFLSFSPLNALCVYYAMPYYTVDYIQIQWFSFNFYAACLAFYCFVIGPNYCYYMQIWNNTFNRLAKWFWSSARCAVDARSLLWNNVPCITFSSMYQRAQQLSVHVCVCVCSVRSTVCEPKS